MADQWPEWLTPEHSAIHTAIENEMKRALQHCFDSADAAGMPWTTEGWISVSASNIMAMLRNAGCPPPAVPADTVPLRLPTEEEHAYDWIGEVILTDDRPLYEARTRDEWINVLAINADMVNTAGWDLPSDTPEGAYEPRDVTDAVDLDEFVARHAGPPRNTEHIYD